jgi:hypothetical protein
MKRKEALKMKIIVTLIFASLALAANPETFTGTITDTLCGPSHTMMKSHPADQCVKLCAKGQYSYALFDGTTVIKLSDQKTPARFAAQKVKITGTLDPKSKTIKVSSIEAMDGN